MYLEYSPKPHSNHNPLAQEPPPRSTKSSRMHIFTRRKTSQPRKQPRSSTTFSRLHTFTVPFHIFKQFLNPCPNVQTDHGIVKDCNQLSPDHNSTSPTFQWQNNSKAVKDFKNHCLNYFINAKGGIEDNIKVSHWWCLQSDVCVKTPNFPTAIRCLCMSKGVSFHQTKLR